MAIVFDFGGVLFQWSPLRLLMQELPAHAGDEARARALVTPFFLDPDGHWARFDRGEIGADEVARGIAARTGVPLAEVREVVAAVPAHLHLLPATAALVQRLRAAGERLFFLSNMPAPFAAHLRAHHPLHEWFEAGVFSGEVGVAKPAAAVFALAQQRFGVPAGELLFFDDHPAYVEAARRAGWQALQFHDAAQAEADLRAGGWWPG